MDQSKITKFTKFLSSKFQIKDLGGIRYTLGIEFSQGENNVTMNQNEYIKDILNRFGMENSKPVATPLDCGIKLKKGEGCPTVRDKDLPFRELIGMLMYLTTCTRPDIAFAVSHLSQFNNCFNETHWMAAKRVLRYLKGTSDVGLSFRRTKEHLSGYTDADWANNLDDRCSYTSYAFILNRCPGNPRSRGPLLCHRQRPNTWLYRTL